MGQLIVIDTQKGWHEEKGIVAMISGKGDAPNPEIKDELVLDKWPKFATPYPLDDQYFLVSCWHENSNGVGIYLADVFDNLVKIKEIPGYALLEPFPLKKSRKPPVIPDRIQPGEKDATVYIHNVYKGEGLKGVPAGTIDKIRVIAYHYGYYGMAGPDKIGYGGPWEATQIIGTADVEKDGSTMFTVPANTPIAFQPLDKEGQAVQLMRSWVTAMPGEYMSCVGCHESPNEIAPTTRAMAAAKPPQELEHWYGPPRGFDFEREVQPVLNKYCIECHNGEKSAIPDLRSEGHFKDYRGKELSDLGLMRLHPNMMKETKGYVKYTPAYDALVPYIRRVSVEDDVSILVPGEYHAGTSPLIQMLKKAHHGVVLNREAWERFFTWIDLNGPCHGTWNDVFPVQDGIAEKRYELTLKYGGPVIDPEYIPEQLPFYDLDYLPKVIEKPIPLTVENWPLSEAVAKQLQSNLGQFHKTISLDKHITINLIKIPAGKFIMGDINGYHDEWPQRVVNISRPFWISSTEITNEQFRVFFPGHDSRYYQKRRARHDGKGLTLNNDKQPAIRVSWQEAVSFCEKLSQKTGMKIELPSGAQWEYACRAGSDTPLFYGKVEDDFSSWANLGDQSFGPYLFKSGGVTHRVMDGAYLADTLHNDQYVVTAPAGTFLPNAWGLYDMHGNASEWVKERDENNYVLARGGSFYDHPKRARSAWRSTYPDWQKVFNVGFRIIAETEE
jgi:formylglycine-generating enzyme required for sulfatase activity